MKSILEVDNKLPHSILTGNADYNCEQENEREIEEMQHIEVAPAMKKAPPPEVSWDFDKIFYENFQEKGIKEENAYPKLKALKTSFEFTDIDDLKNLKWHSKAFVTENFIKNIEEIDDRNKQYQNDYLKPVSMILTHRMNNEVCFIIVSAFKSQHLIKLCHEKKDPKVSIIHIDDVNGPSTVPVNAVVLTKEEINNSVVIIRLFNEDCHYNTEEIEVIKRCVAFVDRNYFHQDKVISEQIYSELESRPYLTKGFMNNKLAAKLVNHGEKILLETESKLGINLQSRFNSIINESIAEDAESVWKLPGLIGQLIRIRVKSEQYERSTLKEILD